MCKSKAFRFTTSVVPMTEISLSGRSGKPLEMTLSGEGVSKTIRMDIESVLKLQAFLVDYLNQDEQPASTPYCRATGRALAIMDADTLDITHVFLAKEAIGIAETEGDDYKDLVQKVASLTDTTLPEKPLFVFFDTYEGTIKRCILHRIIRACVTYQVNYVRTANPFACRPMGLFDIASFTGIDASVISRATRNVRIVTSAGSFTLNATDPSLSTPSLFDEGVVKTHGSKCSRKEVFAVLLQLVEEENPAKAMTDEGFSAELARKGYVVARRTVSKYRDMLGIPKWAIRKVRRA